VWCCCCLPRHHLLPHWGDAPACSTACNSSTSSHSTSQSGKQANNPVNTACYLPCWVRGMHQQPNCRKPLTRQACWAQLVALFMSTHPTATRLPSSTQHHKPHAPCCCCTDLCMLLGSQPGQPLTALAPALSPHTQLRYTPHTDTLTPLTLRTARSVPAARCVCPAPPPGHP
jgi:hypothetical protein